MLDVLAAWRQGVEPITITHQATKATPVLRDGLLEHAQARHVVRARVGLAGRHMTRFMSLNAICTASKKRSRTTPGQKQAALSVLRQPGDPNRVEGPVALRPHVAVSLPFSGCYPKYT